MGASYANYNSDMTRTIPVSGKFSRRQRQIYNAVLRVLRASTNSLRPGLLPKSWQKEAEAHMTEIIASTQGHQPLAVDLEVRMVEDMSIVPGRQQTQPPGKALTGHA